jgi:hypothetical protein
MLRPEHHGHHQGRIGTLFLAILELNPRKPRRLAGINEIPYCASMEKLTEANPRGWI